MSGENDRRHAERLAASGQLSGEVMVFHPMTVLDIARSGVQIETPFPVQLGSLHQFRISLGGLSVVVTGRIVHCRVADLREGVTLYRSGVEFVELSQHAAAALAGFVDALKTWSAPDSVVDGEVIGGTGSTSGV